MQEVHRAGAGLAPGRSENDRTSLPRLRWWWVGSAAGLVIAAGAVVGWWLWQQSYGLAQPEMVQARTEAIRTGLAAAGAVGAALALLLAVRRQRAAEIALVLQDADLAQKERVAAATASDATERRVTELYAKAVEQLGNDKAPVRLGGLHALERLAQDNETHRQTIVDVICAYLRMPYRLPDPRDKPRRLVGEPPRIDGVVDVVESESLTLAKRQHDQQLEQEYHVRKAAQQILAAHLRSAHDKRGEPGKRRYWPSVDIDLTGAYLIDFNLNGCHVNVLTCNDATFVGESRFAGLECDLGFVQNAHFVHTPIVPAGLHGSFAADFRGARFTSYAWFSGTTFDGTPWFHGDEFFPGTCFSGPASFSQVTFFRGARFDGASFGGGVDFTDCRSRVGLDDQQVWPTGWIADSEAADLQQENAAHSRWCRIVRVGDEQSRQ